MGRKKTQEEFENQLLLRNPNICVKGIYKGSNIPIHCMCNICGNEWDPLPTNLLHGYGCPECGKRTISKKLRKDPKDFFNELSIKNPSIKIIGEYVDYKTKILCQCTICGNKWSANPGDIIQGHGCPKCYESRRGTSLRKKHTEFIEQLQKTNPTIIVQGEYKSGKESLQCKCRICGNTWQPKPSDLLQGTGCPECNHIGTSFVEQVLLMALSKALPDIEVKTRDKSTIGMELDIYIPDLKFAIEYGAYYWHKHKLDKDKEKYNRCISKGIRLIRIYERCPNEYEPEADTIVFYNEISSDDEAINDLIIKIFALADIDYFISKNDYHDIKERAYYASRKQTTELFKERIKNINPKIEILGEYKGTHIPIRVQCDVCGNIWNSTPHNLIQGYGCRDCYLAGRYISNDDYINQIKEINPDILIIGNYKGANKPISCKCLKCGKEWEPLAKNLKHHGCPNCSNERRKNQTRISQEEFIKKVSVANPDIEIIGKYIGSHKPIACRCKKCGNEWSPIAYNLTKGHGCRKCFGKRHSEEMKLLYKQGKLSFVNTK